MKNVLRRILNAFRGSWKAIAAGISVCIVFALASCWCFDWFYPSEGQTYKGRYAVPMENVAAEAAQLKTPVEELPENPASTTTTAPVQQVKKSVTTQANPVTTTAPSNNKKKDVTTKSNPVVTTTTTTTTTTITTTTTTTTTLATTLATTTVAQQVKKVATSVVNPVTTTAAPVYNKKVATTKVNPVVQTTATQVVTTVVTYVVTRTETQVVTKVVKNDKKVGDLQKNPVVPDENPVSSNDKSKKVGTVQPNPVGDQGSSYDWPWVVYIPEHMGWYYATKDVESMAQFNGMEYPRGAGWYCVPTGTSLKVESELRFSGTLYSILHNEDQIAKLLEYNEKDERTYSSPLKVPEGLTLEILTYDQSYNEPLIVSEIKTITVSETKEAVETSIYVLTEAEVPETETEAEVEPETTTTTTVATVETTTEPVTTTVTTTTTTLQVTVPATAAVVNRQALPAQTNKIVKFDENVIEELKTAYENLPNILGFAIGTLDEVIYSYNGDKLFPTNCTGKLRILARSLELESTKKDINTGEYHSPFETVTITDKDFLCKDNSTVMSAANGWKVGDSVLLSDADFWSISASDNVGYEIQVQRNLAWYGEDDREWLSKNYLRTYSGVGRYGNQTPKRLLKEAQDSAKYMFSDDQYAYMLRAWCSADYASLPCYIAEAQQKTGQWAYVGYKIGWYESQQCEVVILQDQYGNVIVVVAQTLAGGDTILPKLGAAIRKKTWADGELYEA